MQYTDIIMHATAHYAAYEHVELVLVYSGRQPQTIIEQSYS